MAMLPERINNPIPTRELERRWAAVRAAMMDTGGGVDSAGSDNAPMPRNFTTIAIARSIGSPLSSKTSRNVCLPSKRENRKYSSGATFAFIGSKPGLARSFNWVEPIPPIEGGTAELTVGNRTTIT